MRRFFTAFLLILTSSLLSADFYDGKITRFVEAGFSSTTDRGIERFNTLFSAQAGLSSRWIDAIAGVQAYKDAFDVTIATEAWLPFASWQFETARIALGAGCLYHFQRYKKISAEHDILLDSVFRYQSGSGTTITFRGGFAQKFTRLDALRGAVPKIYDDYPEFGMLIDKVWAGGFEIYFEHALHSLYRYPHFCTPHYLLGAAVNLDSGLRFSGDVSARIADGYSTSPYVNSFLLRFSARYTF